MEKVIELLNEYCGEGEWTIECDVPHNVWHGDYAYEDEVPIIISKQYGFIKWLVENEKVDLDKAKILENGNKAELFEFIDRADYMKIRNRSYFSEYKQLLMLLSIQDNPIEFLVSILK